MDYLKLEMIKHTDRDTLTTDSFFKLSYYFRFVNFVMGLFCSGLTLLLIEINLDFIMFTLQPSG